MDDRSQLVTFYLTCSEPRAWVVIYSDNCQAQVFEMWNGYTNHWSASVWLAPGQYRCRHYSGDECLVAYCGPARIVGSISEGLDGLVSIKPQRDKMNSRSATILIVEDNAAALSAMKSLLQNDGFVVHVADGYQTALQVAKLNQLDLAVCDIKLWDGDGCDLLTELKKLHAIKAIAVTGYTLPEETEHYREAGFGMVLRKPVPHSEILSAIVSLSALQGERLLSPVIRG